MTSDRGVGDHGAWSWFGVLVEVLVMLQARPL